MGVLFESFWVEAVLGLSALFIIIYRFWTLRYNYWKDQNVPHLEPTFPFGNTKDVLLSRKFIGHVFQDFYQQLEGHKYGGIISMRRPQLILRDPELIKIFMTKDFNHFTDRGVSFDEEIDPLSAHLFNLAGERWRILRAKLTPTFTSGKMKMMFHLMQACAKLLQESLIEYADKEETIELKDYMARFGTDVIGACAFGLEIDSIKNPDNEFRRISKELFKPRMIVIVRNLLNSIIPGFSNILKIKTTPKDREDFFFKVVGDTIKYREANKVVRNDFLDLLIQIRNKGQLDDESADKNEHVESSSKINGVSNGIHKSKHSGNGVVSHKSDDIYMTNELMTAQCFVFFIAGFETSSTTLSFCLYELALNQSIQKKLQAEVDRVLAKHNGEISYDALKEMTYMDQVVQEALRKYPPVPILTRECVQEYTVQEGHFKIRKGTRIAIPLFGIHYDPEHYPEPDRFDPDHFTEEAKQSRHHYTWLPFGEGPRICIGMRFGLMQVKSGLATVLSKYNFDRVPETLVPMEFSIDSFVTAPRDGIKLKISKRVK